MLQVPFLLRNFLHSIFSRESLIAILTLLVLVYWYCVVGLFAQGPWKDRYLPGVCIIGLASLVLGALFVRDPACLFLEVLSGILNICTISCLIIDYLSLR
jgi:hypothetical protein